MERSTKISTLSGITYLFMKDPERFRNTRTFDLLRSIIEVTASDHALSYFAQFIKDTKNKSSQF